MRVGRVNQLVQKRLDLYRSIARSHLDMHFSLLPLFKTSSEAHHVAAQLIDTLAHSFCYTSQFAVPLQLPKHVPNVVETSCTLLAAHLTMTAIRPASAWASAASRALRCQQTGQRLRQQCRRYVEMPQSQYQRGPGEKPLPQKNKVLFLRTRLALGIPFLLAMLYSMVRDSTSDCFHWFLCS